MPQQTFLWLGPGENLCYQNPSCWVAPFQMTFYWKLVNIVRWEFIQEFDPNRERGPSPKPHLQWIADFPALNVEALDYVNEAIEHTPTLVELYACKALAHLSQKTLLDVMWYGLPVYIRNFQSFIVGEYDDLTMCDWKNLCFLTMFCQARIYKHAWKLKKRQRYSLRSKQRCECGWVSNDHSPYKGHVEKWKEAEKAKLFFLSGCVA